CVADALLTYEENRNNENENGNGNGNDNRNRSHDSRGGSRRSLHTARGCTYKEFLYCQPLNFKGTEGAVRLAYWFEKMEYVFHISNCAVECQVKYATCILLGGALTWWNSHVRTVGHDAAYKIMVPEEDKVERVENNPRDDHVQQPPYKRQNVVRAYTAGPGEKKEYAGTLPICRNKSGGSGGNSKNLTCFECGKQGHYRSDCPELKNRNRGNQAGSSKARGRVYALGGG
ncbi:reverse transcriptase domain-containing protein, partial [Tanacetum coccineum]